MATPTEAWYLDNLATWIAHYKRLPTIVELADYCNRTITPVWLALVSLEKKGHTERVKVQGGPQAGVRPRFRPVGCEVSK